MGGGVAQGEELGVGGGIAGKLPFVVAPGDHAAVGGGDHRTDRNVPVGRCRRGLIQGEAHQIG